MNKPNENIVCVLEENNIHTSNLDWNIAITQSTIAMLEDKIRQHKKNGGITPEKIIKTLDNYKDIYNKLLIKKQ